MKKVFVSLTIICICLLCSACDGDVTRALRHSGYSVSEGKFECDAFFSKDSTEKIRFLAGSHAITQDGSIYELSYGQKFSNNQNCKLADTPLKVSSILDDSVFLATNGGIYTFGNGNQAAYSEINSSDNNYGTYSTLFYSTSGIKYMTMDSQNGIYYGLSTDGNVYGYTLYSENRDSYPVVAGMVTVYSKADYGDIIDFKYAGDSVATYVRTNDRIYHLTMTNEKDCTTYADIKCNYIMTDDETFEKYMDYIFAYSGSTIITTYQKIFSVGGNS